MQAAKFKPVFYLPPLPVCLLLSTTPGLFFAAPATSLLHSTTPGVIFAAPASFSTALCHTRCVLFAAPASSSVAFYHTSIYHTNSASLEE
jgi:hypothetical protein